MNRRLTQILIGSLLISAIVATIPFIEYNFGVFSAFRSYVLNYGAELFLWLSVTAVAAIVATIALYRANFSVLATATFLVAALVFVSMCLPAQARSLQKYYSHEGRQTRLVEKFNVEISSDGRFQNIELSYWYGKGEGCHIKGSVQSQEDLAILRSIVATKTRLFVDSDVKIIGHGGQ